MASPNVLIADAAGLQTQPNELTLSPGSLAVAENVEITRDGVVEVARGFEDYSENLPDFTPEQILVVGGVAYAHLDNGIWYHDGSNWLRKPGSIAGNYSNPVGLWLDAANRHVYIAGFSTGECIIRLDLDTGRSEVFAGRLGIPGSSDGVGDAARFNNPKGIWGDGLGNLYVADQSNHTIRKIVIATRTVSTLAGTAGASGTTDDVGASARFNGPSTVWGDGTNLYVADQGNHSIRKIVISGAVVTTFAGSTAGASGTTDGTGTAALFSGPGGLWGDGSNLYVAEEGNDCIRKVTLSGAVVTAFAGLPGSPGLVDGTGTAARFTNPLLLWGDGAGALYTGGGGGAIRKITYPDAVVTSPAGTLGVSGDVDGIGSSAQITSLRGIWGDGDTIYFVDSNKIRVFYPGINYVASVSGSYSADAAYGIAAGPDRRMRAAALNGNTYFTTNRGVVKSESAAGSISAAGLPRCLDLTLALTGSPGTLLTDTGSSPTAGANQARSYRGVWCIRDANNNLIVGAPSSRFSITNTAGAVRDVSVTTRLPAEITTGHFFALYASEIVDFGDTVDPGDELQQIFEYFPTSTDITNGTLTITDNVPDDFRGPQLYSNDSQEGIAQQNSRPPLSRDICAYRRRMLYANYTEPHRMTLQLLGTTGMVAGQTLTIAGVAYTVAAAEDVSTGSFLLYTAGTQAIDVETTAKSLCYVINGYAANTSVYAYYVSGVDDAPGTILIEERGVGGDAFVATCSASAIGNLFSPAIPTTGSDYTSVANRRVNRIRVSKTDEPEACPEGDEIIVGGEDEEIQRIIPLRSSVIVIKDKSVWRLVEGLPAEEPTFLDDTVSIAGRDSAAKLNNTVFFLSDQGFVAVSDNGAQIAGRPIERFVIAGLESIDAPNHDVIVATGCEQRRLYICSVWDPAAAERTCYMFSPIANKGKGAWTKRRLNANAFAVLDNRILYALNSETGNILRSRASLRDDAPWYRDFCEEASTINITAIDTTENVVTCTFTSGVDYEGYEGGPDIGWKFYDGSNQYLVTGANGASDPTWTLVCNTVADLTTGEKTIYRPVRWTAEWAPITGGNPLDMKQFVDVVVKAETHNAYAIDFEYANQSDAKETPYHDDWDDNPPADRVFVPKKSGERASLTNNDFGATVGLPVPFNEIRSQVHPQRAMGQQLSVRMSGGTAEGYVGIKALVVQTIAKDSNKGRP
jgi:hypothetical protein